MASVSFVSQKSNALNIVSKIDKESFKTSVLSDVETSYLFETRKSEIRIKNSNKLQFVGRCYRSAWDSRFEATAILHSKQDKSIRNGAWVGITQSIRRLTRVEIFE